MIVTFQGFSPTYDFFDYTRWCNSTGLLTREFWLDCQTMGYTRRRSKGKCWRRKYVSLNLVRSYWANLGGYREIGDARAFNDVLDDRARHHRIDHRRQRYPHVFAPEERTISSRRPHFLHTGRDPGA